MASEKLENRLAIKMRSLGVSVEVVLGEPNPSKGKTPGGKLGEVFEAASHLPRRQQQKIAEVVEGMLPGDVVVTNGHYQLQYTTAAGAKAANDAHDHAH